VLPFSYIDDKRFSVSLPLISKLRTLYIMRAEESIIRFRTAKNNS